MIPACDGGSDRRSDGQTESIIAKTALSIASYADALSKIAVTRSIFGEKIAKMRLRQELCPRPPMGSIQRSPKYPLSAGKWNSRRLRHLYSRRLDHTVPV